MKSRIQVARPVFSNHEINEIKKTFKTGWVTPGPQTEKLELIIKKKLKAKYAIAVNSCTSGIAASLTALGAKRGDEVLTPSNTFVSTINTIYNMGLKIRLCDVDFEKWSVTDSIFKKSLTKKTKFFIPVHFGGNPVDIDKIIATAKKNKIKIIDDAATAIGARIKKKYLGSYNGTITVFSLHANKIINSAEGGIITLNNKKIAKSLRKLINSGLEKSSWQRMRGANYKPLNIKIPGYKFNYNDVLASIAIPQLKNIDKIINYRKKIYKQYTNNLKNLIDKKIIRLQKTEKKNRSSLYCFQIYIEKNNIRNRLAHFLDKNNISTTVYYTPAHMHDFYKKKINSQNQINCNKLFHNSLSLPFHNDLKFKDIKKVSNLVNKFFNDSK
jgi:dTDP-4-amino-4,6-dideoxygalactose transaminase